MANELRFRATLDDKVTGSLLKIGKAFDKVGGKGSSASLFGNVGAKAVASGFGLIEQAAGGFIDVIERSVHAAIADEESQAKLRTSLMANIPAWQGNTDAIEKVLQARIKLGFSDEEQRRSLSLLVAATHDVDKALKIQSVAMDLARFKGISLEEATGALTKVEAGRFRILASLGIVLRKGATAQDALNAVEAVASGQAEDYARTVGGKLLIAQTRINEKMEDLGRKILPVVADALDVVSSALDDVDAHKGPIVDLAKAFDDMGKQLDYLSGASRHAGEETDILGSKTTLLGQVLHDIFDAGWRDRMGHASDDIDHTGSAFNVASAKAKGFADTAWGAANRVTQSFDDMVAKLKQDVASLISDVYDPIAERDALRANRVEADAQRAIIASKKSTDAEIADAKRRLHSLEADNVDYLAKLVESGDATTSEYARLMRILVNKSHHSTGKAKADVDALIAKLKELHRVEMADLANFTIRIEDTRRAKPGEKRARGGPVMPGEAYTVGEQGPETLVMGNKGGTIIPNGSGLTVNFYSTFPPSPSQGQAIAQQLMPALIRAMRQQGFAN